MAKSKNKVRTRLVLEKAAKSTPPLNYQKASEAASDADIAVHRAHAVDMARLGLSDFYRRLFEDIFYALLVRSDSPSDMESELCDAVTAVADAEDPNDLQRRDSIRGDSDARSAGIAWAFADMLIRRRTPQ